MAETMPAYTGQECDWYNAPCHISSSLEWVYDFTLWVPHKLVEKLLDGLASFLVAIPVPEFFGAAASGLAAVPPGVAFFVSFAQIPQGIGMVLSAYGLRFIVRRIPLIG